MTIEQMRLSAEKVGIILGLDSSLVGVKFMFAEKELPPAVEQLAGHRVHGSTAVLQAVCVDATLVPFVHKSFNMSMEC